MRSFCAFVMPDFPRRDLEGIVVVVAVVKQNITVVAGVGIMLFLGFLGL